MSRTSQRRWLAVVVLAASGLLARSAAAQATTVLGEARAAQATTLGLFGGTTTVLAGTGPLSDTADARDASQLTGSIGSLLRGEVLDAVTIGWSDQVMSEASLAGLGMTVGGVGISADFVMARATAVYGAAGAGASQIENLAINGMPIAVSGAPNQVVSIPGGQLVINEQRVSSAGTTVNALHATIVGLADVVVASATAGIR